MEARTEVQSDVQRRAELRKRKILERSEERMSKILGYKAESIDLVSEIVSNESDVYSSIASSIEKIDAPVSLDTTRSVVTDRDEDDTMDDEETMYRERNQQFPRKVSLISTPIDFRHQQSKRNGSYAILSPLLKLNSQTLVSTLLLVVTAVISSYYSLSCIIPFLLTQSFKYVYVTSSSNNVHVLNVGSMVYDLIGEFLIFCFVYIIMQALTVG